jgi:TP901 family phage tail tape measure protein
MTRTFQALPGILGVVGGAGIVRSIGRIAEGFDQAMNQSLAIMRDVGPQLRREMEEVAIRVARTTTASADEAAKSYFFLASAGLDVQQSIAALPTVAQFATAGMFDMAQATDLLTDAQSALGLTVMDAEQNMRNMTRVADVLVAANTLANASVEQFSRALTNKGAVAMRRYGKEIEEGVAVLAAFADQGIKDAEAGTALNIVVRDMTSKALLNREAFRKMGIVVFDQQGEFRNLGDVVSDLEQALSGLSDAQRKGTLLTLGFTDKSVAFLSTLIGMSDKIKEYEAGVRAAGGTMKDVAERQLTPWQKAMAQINASMTEFGRVTQPARNAIAEIAGGFAASTGALAEWIEQGPAGSASFQTIAVRVAALGLAVTGLVAGLTLLWKTAAFLVFPAFAALANVYLLVAAAVALVLDHIIALERINIRRLRLLREVQPHQPGPYFHRAFSGKVTWRPTWESHYEAQDILNAFRGPGSAAEELRRVSTGPGAVHTILERLTELVTTMRETRDAVNGVGALR